MTLTSIMVSLDPSLSRTTTSACPATSLAMISAAMTGITLPVKTMKEDVAKNNIRYISNERAKMVLLIAVLFVRSTDLLMMVSLLSWVSRYYHFCNLSEQIAFSCLLAGAETIILGVSHVIRFLKPIYRQP